MRVRTRQRSTDVVVIGAGQSGLAMSAHLAARGIDHVILERATVGSSWRRRWDSLRLLTPNAHTRLPGLQYEGDNPDGFMSKDETAAFIEAYGALIGAPVRAGVDVTAVRADPVGPGYVIETSDGPWNTTAVVLASGPAERAARPDFSSGIPRPVTQLDSLDYRRPGDLPDGGVLVVGAAASGVQIAEEVHASGRPVTLSAGEHVRMVRRHRGRDVHHWMDAVGLFDERHDDVESIDKARAVSSPQLVGTTVGRDLDLTTLQRAGVDLRGRASSVRDGTLLFSGGLRNHCALADQKLRRLLATIDEWIDHNDPSAITSRRDVEPTPVPKGTPLALDFARSDIRTVLWATGMRPDHRYVDLPVFDDHGRIRHDGGVVRGAPGLYLLGAPFLRRRRSSFLSGAGSDAEELAVHLAAHVGQSDPC